MKRVEEHWCYCYEKNGKYYFENMLGDVFGPFDYVSTNDFYTVYIENQDSSYLMNVLGETSKDYDYNSFQYISADAVDFWFHFYKYLSGEKSIREDLTPNCFNDKNFIDYDEDYAFKKNCFAF